MAGSEVETTQHRSTGPRAPLPAGQGGVQGVARRGDTRFQEDRAGPFKTSMKRSPSTKGDMNDRRHLARLVCGHEVGHHPSGAAFLPMPGLDCRNGSGHKLLQNTQVNLAESLEVQTSLAKLVLTQPGQKLCVIWPFSTKVDHEVRTSNGISGQAGLTCATALISVCIRPEPDDARPPHLGFLLGDACQQDVQGLAVRDLRALGPRRDVLADARGVWLGLGICNC